MALMCRHIVSLWLRLEVTISMFLALCLTAHIMIYFIKIVQYNCNNSIYDVAWDARFGCGVSAKGGGRCCRVLAPHHRNSTPTVVRNTVKLIELSWFIVCRSPLPPISLIRMMLLALSTLWLYKCKRQGSLSSYILPSKYISWAQPPLDRCTANICWRLGTHPPLICTGVVTPWEIA